MVWVLICFIPCSLTVGGEVKSFLFWSLAVVLIWTALFSGGIKLFSYLSAPSLSAESYFRPADLRTSSFLARSLPGFKTYRHKKLGLEFEYPDILKVTEKEGVITVEHRVAYKHPNPCDGSGLSEHQDSKEIFDFYAQISVLPLTPTELFRQEVMQKNDEGMVVGIHNTVRVTYGALDGFRMFAGHRRCGYHSYFFQLADEKVLRVVRYLVPEFEVSEKEKEAANRLRQVILPEQEEHIFRGILSSLRWSGQ